MADLEKKKKKKMNIHLLLNTPLEGKLNKIKLNLIKTRLSGLRKASLTLDEEAELKKILSSIAGEEVEDKRGSLATKMLMLEDVKSRLLEDPDNKTLTQELDMKENDVKWMIEDILRDDRKSKGIFTDNVMAKLTAKLLTAEKFDESKHPRDESGEFSSGEGGDKEKKDDLGSKARTDPSSGLGTKARRAPSGKEVEGAKVNIPTGDVDSEKFFDGLSEKNKIQFLAENGIMSRDSSEEAATDGTLNSKNIGDTVMDAVSLTVNPSEEEMEGVKALEKEKSLNRSNTRIADSVSIQGLETKRFTEAFNLSTRDANKIRGRIAEERAVTSIGKKDKKFSEKLEKALTEQESIDKQIVAMEGLSRSEVNTIHDFLQKNPSRARSTELSEENKATLKRLNDVKGMILSRADNPQSKTGKLRTGSLVDEYHTASGDRYVTYFLLNDQTNLKGWGVTAKSIRQNIGTFKNMPFVITKTKFFPRSAYGEITDHPSTEHFQKLGIKVGRDRPRQKNDMMQQASFQEEFRVGNIDEIVRSTNGDWLAFIKIKQQFADYEMPPLVSPAIFQLNPMEPMDNISTWVGMHLAGLDESPAYGNDALYKGSCFGDKNTCLTQLSAKLPAMMAYLPPCALKKMYNARVKVAQMKIAVMLSTDPGRMETQRQNILCKKDDKLSACPQNTGKKKKTFGMRERTAGGPGSGPQKGQGGRSLSEKTSKERLQNLNKSELKDLEKKLDSPGLSKSEKRETRQRMDIVHENIDSLDKIIKKTKK